MPQTRKIATCCYCGARSVLVLNRARHELGCSSCGAPLHDMKFMPVSPEASEKRAACVQKPSPYRQRNRKRPDEDHRYDYRRKDKRRKSKPLSRKIFEELWDVVEDIFD